MSTGPTGPGSDAGCESGPKKQASGSGSKAAEQRFARRCYGHLAGVLGVAVTEALIARGLLRIASPTSYDLTDAGRAWLAGIGVAFEDMAQAGAEKPAKAPARRCLDGTERRDHLGGPLAVRLLERMMVLGWLERTETPRALRLTPVGAQALDERLGIRLSRPAVSPGPVSDPFAAVSLAAPARGP